MRINNIKLACIGALLSGFFLGAPFAFASSIVITGASATPLNYLLFTDNGATSTAPGVPGSFQANFEGVGTNHSSTFDVSVYTGTPPVLCATSSSQSVSALGIPVYTGAGDPTGAVYRTIPLSTGACLISAGTHVEFGINSSFNDIQIAGYSPDNTNGHFHAWLLLTTDTATSTIYDYQNTIVGVATSSNASYCTGQYPGTGFGDSMGYALCTVSGFLFIPAPATISQFTALQIQLASRFPFAWAANLQNIINNYTASSSPNNFIDLNLNFGSTTAPLGFTTLDAISTSTVSTYFPDSIRNALKLLIAATFYLAAASFIYRKLQQVWNNNNA